MSDIKPQDLSGPPPGSRRAAWVLVIIMSVLLVLALLAVVWGFVRQGRILLAARQAPPVAAASLTLSPGARIISAQTEAGRLVLRVATPEGEEIDIIDLASGRLVGQVKATE